MSCHIYFPFLLSLRAVFLLREFCSIHLCDDDGRSQLSSYFCFIAYLLCDFSIHSLIAYEKKTVNDTSNRRKSGVSSKDIWMLLFIIFMDLIKYVFNQ